MRLLETGRSFKSIHKEYGIDSVQLRVLWEKYKIFGAPSKYRSQIL